MTNRKRKVSEGKVTASHAKSALSKDKAKSSFEFEIRGEFCRCWLFADGDICFGVPDEESGKQLHNLIRHVERLIVKASRPGLKRLDFRRFLAKLMQMEISIEEERLRSLDSRCVIDPSSLRPLDTEKLSDEDRRFFEALKEKTEIAIAAAEKDGVRKERIPLTTSIDIVTAKLEQRQKK
jgi:hypothetical protein